eukprot:3840061-Amphidinium_carterae.4
MQEIPWQFLLHVGADLVAISQIVCRSNLYVHQCLNLEAVLDIAVAPSHDFLHRRGTEHDLLVGNAIASWSFRVAVELASILVTL